MIKADPGFPFDMRKSTEWTDRPVHDSPPRGLTRVMIDRPSVVKLEVSGQFARAFPGALASFAAHVKPQAYCTPGESLPGWMNKVVGSGQTNVTPPGDGTMKNALSVAWRFIGSENVATRSVVIGTLRAPLAGGRGGGGGAPQTIAEVPPPGRPAPGVV